MTARLIGEDAAHRDVQVVISGSCPTIMADAELLKIVFLNLFLNSAHAMRQEGAITVSLAAGDGSCRIAVSDTGPGIPPEVRARLFTPFVTTKSRGTGLGPVDGEAPGGGARRRDSRRLSARGRDDRRHFVAAGDAVIAVQSSSPDAGLLLDGQGCLESIDCPAIAMPELLWRPGKFPTP